MNSDHTKDMTQKPGKHAFKIINTIHRERIECYKVEVCL